MNIGPYQLHSVLTSNFGLDGGAMFGVVPKILWEKKINVDSSNRIDMVTRSLLIVGEGKKILVDTGNGDKWDEKSKKIYNIDIESVNIEKSLAKINLKPEDITDVIITHLHFDHAGGATKKEGDKIVPTFANANYYVQESNYQHACNPTERDRASYLKENWQPLEKAGVLKIVDGPCELFPGIKVLIVHGHTTGQQLPLISDGKQSVLYCGDLCPTSVHVPVPWIMGYDLRPLVILEEKKEILGEAAEKNWILFYEHDPKWAASHVVKTKKGFAPGELVSF